MSKLSSLSLALLSSLLPACVSTPDEHLQPLVSMNSGIKINPESEYLRGKLLHLQGRYDEARQAYLSVLAMDKDHAEARNGLAALLGAQGDLDRSIALLSGMAQAGTRLPHVYVNLGHAWMKKGQRVQARTALERALELDPDNLAAKEKMAALMLLENPSPVPASKNSTTSNASVSLVSVNPIERLSDGLYVLRYKVPVDESVPAAAERLPDVVLSTKTRQATEPAAEVTEASAPSERAKDSESQRLAPVMAIEVANGNGVQGLARSLRGLLAGQRWRVVRTINHVQFGVRFTRIEYTSNLAEDARDLADGLGIDAKFRLNNQQTGTQMRIILGHDLKDLSLIRQRLVMATQTAGTSSVMPVKPYDYRSEN
jgi:tetratricopeptide (TPR) repeat protein